MQRTLIFFSFIHFLQLKIYFKKVTHSLQYHTCALAHSVLKDQENSWSLLPKIVFIGSSADNFLPQNR